jgi:voltage-gated potassium channel
MERRPGTREKLQGVIFGVESRWGRAFDIVLIGAIVVSVVLAMLETVEGIGRPGGLLGLRPAKYETALRAAGWIFTALFTLEYALRLYCAEKRLRYARSFFGIVDFLAVGPVYIGLFVPGGQYFVLVRVLRILRIFRVFGLASYEQETRVMLSALGASARRIIVFLLFVLTMVVMLGSLMYLIEGRANGFTSIPRSIYWAVVTLTTVGYGDISPKTPLGQGLAGLIMILGYSLIVVPTGFVSVAVADAMRQGSPENCPACGKSPGSAAAHFCMHCGRELEA